MLADFFDVTPELIELHAVLGDRVFLGLCLVVSILLSVLAIPWATHLMVNNAAGLAKRYFGPKSRTLVINASTNSPEAVSMFVSFGLGRLGGWANPLGSLFANVYLLYGAALVWVSLKFTLRRDFDSLRRLAALLRAEWKLVLVHVFASLVMFAFGYVALRVMMGDGSPPAPGWPAVAVLVLVAAGIVAFRMVEKPLKRLRPELFEDMDESSHGESFLLFSVGTVAVVVACWVMNALFLGWTFIYEAPLSKIFGGALIFAWLHWLVGALITSLPELTVAVNNFEKLQAPELNTALGSVSYSNYVNLWIALVGLVAWFAMGAFGVPFVW